MRKIEAQTLEDAYEKAALELECSITELRYEVIQHPSDGLFGLFKKNAIIVADCKRDAPSDNAVDEIIRTIAAEEIVEEVLEEQHSVLEEIVAEDNPSQEEIMEKPEPVESAQRVKHALDEELTQQDDVILGSFFDGRQATEEKRPENNNLELAEKIEADLAELLSHSCFAIDTVEVDVVDNNALIFIDGDDAALLIGKEGYRYNALSYMLFNWLHSKYNLYIKLEIAQFLTSQQEMIRNYIKPVIEHVNTNGKGKTRPLDGILVQIALEQLREEFPDKYVAVKTIRDGRKFVMINEFNNRSHA